MNYQSYEVNNYQSVSTFKYSKDINLLLNVITFGIWHIIQQNKKIEFLEKQHELDKKEILELSKSKLDAIDKEKIAIDSYKRLYIEFLEVKGNIRTLEENSSVDAYISIIEKLLLKLEKFDEFFDLSDDSMKAILDNLSHEFRTPLNAISGYAEMMMDDFSTGSQEYNDLQNIINSSKRLNYTIRNLLNAFEISFKEPFLIGNINISADDILKNIKNSFQGLFKKKEIEFTYELENDIGQINTNEETLIEIMFNIIGNAIKFSDHNSKINLKIYKNEETIFFEISDEGIGIGEEHFNDIFNPLWKASKGETQEYIGLGLGLYTVKKKIKYIGGNISVQSELGEGSTFTISIPKE